MAGLNHPVSDLPKNVLQQLVSAQGWLNLGDWEEANSEIEDLPAEFKTHPLLLSLRIEICRSGGAWPLMAEISRHLTTVQPGEFGHWLNYSYALRRSEGPQTAKAVLEGASRLFPQEYVIWFNLACYSAQMGQIDEARGHLKQAFELNPGCQQAALDDPDLRQFGNKLIGPLCLPLFRIGGL